MVPLTLIVVLVLMVLSVVLAIAQGGFLNPLYLMVTALTLIMGWGVKLPS